MKIKLISCVGVDSSDDLVLLPHFLRHYRELGVPAESMHVILNAPRAESAGFAQAQAILREAGAPPGDVWIARYTSDTMWARRREVQVRVAAPEDWVLNADVDEFHQYPAALPEVLDFCAAKGSNCVQGVFIDRITPDGQLLEPMSELPPAERFPRQTDIICTIGRQGQEHDWYGTVKLMVSRGDVFPSRGGHHPQRGETPVRYLLGRPLASFPLIAAPWFRFSLPFRVHHYKWTAGLVPGLRRRLSTPGVSPAGREYGQKLLDHIERHGGIAIDQVPRRRFTGADALSWRWRVLALRRLARAGTAARSLRGKLTPTTP